MESQAELAKKYGVYGFCYYHYWFGHGKKLLEKPIERMLRNPNIAIPFCLSWDNNDWSKKYWDDGSPEIIAAQDYSDKDNLDRHIDYLCEFFADPRYIKIDGKPLFLVYQPQNIPHVHERFQYVRERINANGFLGIVIAAQSPAYDFLRGECIDLGVDLYIQRQPGFATQSLVSKLNQKQYPVKTKIKRVLLKLGILKYVQALKHALAINVEQENTVQNKTCTILDYDAIWEENLSDRHEDKRFIAGSFCDFDDTPRRKAGHVYFGASPEKFGVYMRRMVQKVREEYYYPYLFLNAWNEWGEGMYLEPDERYGYAYLEALRDALTLQ